MRLRITEAMFATVKAKQIGERFECHASSSQAITVIVGRVGECSALESHFATA
ncbi:hypothetical protein QN399_05305 [Pseudomonas sp. 10C3]|uniref:hypothetical protein n=1 Tax=Pseudomonas sp. 10C3 TaxID=3118753 RepID=UPI002E81219F|nr:hypothetical protein [Pseudomonas sp. 10C3]MEE3505689.1 hypothetical protein [Pseudomonas sp. 10C3]